MTPYTSIFIEWTQLETVDWHKIPTSTDILKTFSCISQWDIIYHYTLDIRFLSDSSNFVGMILHFHQWHCSALMYSLRPVAFSNSIFNTPTTRSWASSKGTPRAPCPICHRYFSLSGNTMAIFAVLKSRKGIWKRQRQTDLQYWILAFQNLLEIKLSFAYTVLSMVGKIPSICPRTAQLWHQIAEYWSAYGPLKTQSYPGTACCMQGCLSSMHCI